MVKTSGEGGRLPPDKDRMHATADSRDPLPDAQRDVTDRPPSGAAVDADSAKYHVSSQQLQRRIWEDQHRQLRGRLLQMILDNEQKRQQERRDR